MTFSPIQDDVYDANNAVCNNSSFSSRSHYQVYLQETTAIDGRAWALAELPVSVPQFDTCNNQQGPLQRADPPLVVTQHMEPTRRFVLLNSQVSILFSLNYALSFWKIFNQSNTGENTLHVKHCLTLIVGEKN